MAKIVRSLGGSKKYGPVGRDVWSFSGLNGETKLPGPDFAEELEAETAARDPELARMKLQMKSLKDKLANEQIWIEDVKTIVKHYRQKVGAVQLSMKADAHKLQEIKAMIIARRKLGARRALEEKLSKVHKQLTALQAAAQDVSGEAKSLTTLRTNLNRSIGSIQHEIEKLRSQDPGHH
jgi:predicted  nucleic acid-binding Zn-ribbon protein